VTPDSEASQAPLSPPKVPARADFVVVGGGVTGLSAAWALTRLGRDVVVLDLAPIGHRDGGSHGSCRIFRLGYDDPAYVRLARDGRELWTMLAEISGEQLLHPAPQLTFGPKKQQVTESMQAAGAPYEVLPAAEAAARFPGVAVTGDDVLVEPDSAVIAADRTLAALTGLTGVIRTGVRVTALADDGRRVKVSTEAGGIEADRVIVCTGPWTAGLLATAGIKVPGSAMLEQLAFLRPAGATAATPDPPGPQAPPMPIFVHYGGLFAYGLPEPGTDRYKLGLHHSGVPVDPDQQDHTPDPHLSRRIEDAARRFLPGHDPRAVATERCIYDDSPDEGFIVDRIGNVVIGSGTSGHGFKFGPLLGEWLARLAINRPEAGANPPTTLVGPSHVPNRFALSRF